MILRGLILPRSIISEAGEGHRWKFDYENFHHDPNPDVLVLGSYRHPRTKNELVGAINLNYLNSTDLNDLRKSLPELTKIRGLKKRYRYGSLVLPHIFDNFYRQYNTDSILNLDKGVLYPVYGVLRKDKDEAAAAIAKKKSAEKEQPQRVGAQSDIRDIEREYDKELEKQASETPVEPQMQTPQDKQVLDRYAQTIAKPTPQAVAKDRTEIERQYADDKDEIEGQVAGQADPDIEDKPAVAQAKPEETDADNIEYAKPVRTVKPAQPMSQSGSQVSPETPQAPVTPTTTTTPQTSVSRSADYAGRPSIEKSIEDVDLDNTVEDEVEDLYDMDESTDADVVSTDENIDESKQRQTITYYSPRLKRYIIEAI